MNSKQFNIDKIPQDGVIIIREGEALPLREDIPIVIEGDITAPATWVITKEFDPFTSHVLVDIKNTTIILHVDEHSYFKATISGKIKENSELSEFNINNNKRYSQQELSQLLKFKKMFFPDKDRHLKILEQLSSLKGTVIQNFENANDNKGNKKFLLEKTLKEQFDFGFSLSIPIFENTEPSSFQVEVNYDITDGDVRFWLESVELKEMKYIIIHKILEKEIAKISAKIKTIIYV